MFETEECSARSIYSHAQVWQSCTYTVLSECVHIVPWLRPLWMENWAEGCSRMIRISRKSRGWRRYWNVRAGAGEPGSNRDCCLSVRSSWSDPRTCLSLPQLISDRRFPLAPTTTLNLAPFKALQTLIVSIRSFIIVYCDYELVLLWLYVGLQWCTVSIQSFI